MIKNIVNMQEYVITFVETEMNNKRGGGGKDTLLIESKKHNTEFMFRK